MTAPAGVAPMRRTRATAALRDWAADDAAGEPGADLRGPLRLGLATLVLLAVALGGWGLGGRVAAVVAAPGVVVVAGGPLPVAVPEPGIVAEVGVRDGDRVRAGALLYRMDTAALDLEAARLAAEMRALAERRARLVAEAGGAAIGPTEGPEAGLAGARASLRAVQDRRAAAADRAARAELAAITADRVAAERQRALVAAAQEDAAALARAGLARRAELAALDREAARLDGVIDRSTAAARAIAARRAEARLAGQAERSAERVAARAALVDLAAAERALAARAADVALRRARTELRAPVAGQVFAQRVTAPGAVVGAGVVLLQIVPDAAAPAVLARLDPAQAAAVREGQAARILYLAPLPDGPRDLPARVLAIAPDAQGDAAGTARWVEVRLVPQSGAALPRPGTPVEVLLSRGEAAPLGWLAAPVARHWARVFRDG